MSRDPSVTEWIDLLKSGDEEAAQDIWEHYCQRLVLFARKKFAGTSRRTYDEEDAALSAFKSFCEGVAVGKFPQLNDRHNLWRILVVLTTRKISARARYERRQKRGQGKTRSDSVFQSRYSDEQNHGFDQVVGPDPTPEFIAQLAEECQSMLEILDDDSMRRVALLRLEGFTNDEIAEKLGCTRRSVQRKLERIRLRWTERAED